MKKLIGCMLGLVLLPVSVFAQGLPLKDGVASTLATIEDCGSSKNCVLQKGPTNITGSGFQSLSGQTGVNTTSSSKRFNPVYVGESKGQLQAVSQILFQDVFNATTQNTSNYKYNITTMTMSQSGGFLTTNASGINTINTNAALQTNRFFPFFNKAELRINISALKVIAPQTNETIEMGLMTATVPGATVPIDGCFFRWNAAAELRGVCNVNSVETQTTAITSPSIAVVHHYQIVINGDAVVFSIDDLVVGTITMVSDIPGAGQPGLSTAVPFTVRHINGAIAPTLTTQRLQISNITILQVGSDLDRTWGEVESGNGQMAYQGQNGGTMGTTANALNAATPAASALTNTAISTGSPVGLGGLAHVLPSLAVGTDGILFSFQNPVGGTGQTPRNLIIRGVSISGGVDLVLSAAGLLVYTYSLAYGHTAVSMATAESGTFVSPSTKAPRRIWLGVQTTLIAAAAGTPLSNPINISFESPIVVAPGEFVAITVRNQGVVTATGSVIITAAFNAYFE
jgi:hypothetical protein